MRANAQRFRVAFGVVLALSGLALVFNVDTTLQKRFPDYTKPLQDLTEASHSGRAALKRGENVVEDRKPTATRAPGLPDYGPAPDFGGISRWFNSTPLMMAQLRGKVVLIDFWTYSCINCLRTLPHLEAWDRMYRKDGLVIVGVHTPEFAFESVPSNVGGAVERLGVHYPVALDPNYDTWNRYGNQYWPAEYLVDKQGHVRHAHFGEGSYDETEGAIRTLLGEKPASPASDLLPDPTPSGQLTPETYLGYARLDRFTGSETISRDREATYTFPPAIGKDDWAYAGRWKVGPQRVVAGDGASLRLRYRARKVYIVLGGHGAVQVLVDGKPRQTMRVTADKLYTVVDKPDLQEGLLELRFTPGVQAYSFTFG